MVFVDRGYPVIAETGAIVFVLEINGEALRIPVEPVQPQIRSCPQRSGSIHEDRPRHVVRKGAGDSRIIAVSLEVARSRVKPADASCLSSGPQHSPRLYRKASYVIAAEALRIRRIVPVRDEASGGGVEMVQSPTLCANPKLASTVFFDGGDRVVRKAVGILGGVLVNHDLSCLSIQPVKSGIRPDPKKSASIREHGQDLVASQSVWVCRILPVIHEGGGRGLKPADPGLAAHPQIPFRIFEQRPDQAPQSHDRVDQRTGRSSFGPCPPGTVLCGSRSTAARCDPQVPCGTP